MNREYYELELLRTMVHNQEFLPYIFETIQPKYFENKLSANVFRSMALLWKNNRTINKQTIDAHSSSSGVDDNTWTSFLNELELAPTLQLEECVDFIIDAFVVNELRRKTKDLSNQVVKDSIDFPLFVHTAEDIISTVSMRERGQKTSEQDIFMEDGCLEFNDIFLKERFVIYRKNLTFIAGAAKNQKTSLACFMENDLLKSGYKILHFPVDASYKETMANLISMNIHINRELIVTHSKKKPTLTDEEFERVKEEHERIRKEYIETGQLVIDDKSNSLPEINLKIRIEKPDLVIVDLINSIVLPGVEKGDTTEAFETPVILNRLKQLAKQLNCAVLGLVWLNTTRKRPYITDLYGSKASEKWASKVWLVYYDFVYSTIPNFRDVFEIIDGASRFGENKIHPVKVRPEYCWFGYSDHDDAIKKTYRNVTKLPAHLVWKRGGGNV